MTEQPETTPLLQQEWLRLYNHPVLEAWRKGRTTDGAVLANAILIAACCEISHNNDRIARLEAGQRELEARLGDGE